MSSAPQEKEIAAWPTLEWGSSEWWHACTGMTDLDYSTPGPKL